MLPHKDDQCHIRDAADPGIANELRIERKQTLRTIWVTTRCSFPVDQATHPVDLTYRIEIANKFAASRQHLKKFDLEILAWVLDANPVILCEPLQQVDSLMHETIPGLSLFEFEGSITVGLPFLEQHSATILFAEVSSQSILKAAPKSHGRTSFLFAPAIEVTETIAARTAEILADLRVAIDHRDLPVRPVHQRHRLTRKRPLPTHRRVRRNQDSGKNAHSQSCAR